MLIGRTTAAGILTILVVLTTGTTDTASGHDPAGMTLDYDPDTQQLEVTIEHIVGDETLHYVEEVIIQKNGAFHYSETYNSQPTTSTFTYTYQVDASDGDTISAEAVCNQVGSIQRTIQVGGGAGEFEEEEDSPFPALWAMFLIAALMAHSAFRRRPRISN